MKARAEQKRSQSAINYRMRLASRANSFNTATNLQQFVEEIAPRLDPSVEMARSWPELISLANTMDSMPIAEGKERYGEASSDQGLDITRMATWFLGEHGIAIGVSYADFRYRWE